MRLLEKYQLGTVTLPNRIVMAPMTRNRAPGGVPNERMAAYYAQRASVGLIVSEGTQVTAVGQGYQDTPGIYTGAQREGWRNVTNSVHAGGGHIFAQLWHVGRVSHSYYHGMVPVAPSAIPPPGKAYIPEGPLPYETPHALEVKEIAEIVGQFRHAATIAREAGFDGVEIHGANCLSHRSVPAQRYQSAGRPVRREHRESLPIPARSDARGAGSVGRSTRRCSLVTRWNDEWCGR